MNFSCSSHWWISWGLSVLIWSSKWPEQLLSGQDLTCPCDREWRTQWITPWLSKRRALLPTAFLVIVAGSSRVGEDRRRTGKRHEVSVSDSNDFQSPRCKTHVQIWVSGFFRELSESCSVTGTGTWQESREGGDGSSYQQPLCSGPADRPLFTSSASLLTCFTHLRCQLGSCRNLRCISWTKVQPSGSGSVMELGTPACHLWEAPSLQSGRGDLMHYASGLGECEVIVNRGKNSNLRGLWWGMNEKVHTKHLVWCQGQKRSNCSILVPISLITTVIFLKRNPAWTVNWDRNGATG